MTNKRPQFTTPIGILSFPCAIKEADTKFADQGNPNDKGNFVARLVLPKSDAKTQKLLGELNEVYENHTREEAAKLQKGKKLKITEDSVPWTDEVDRETGEPTGNVILKTKLKARVVKKDKTFFDQRPKVFDAKGVLVKEVPNIGPGSKVRLSVSVNTYHTSIGCGMSLRLDAVQLLDLVERGGRDAKGYGFGEEDGFEAPAESPGFPAESGGEDGDY